MPQNAKRSQQLGSPTVSRGVQPTDPGSTALIVQLQREAGNAALSSRLGSLPREAGARTEAWLTNSRIPRHALVGSLMSVSRQPAGGTATVPGTIASKAPTSKAPASTAPAPPMAKPAPPPPPIAWINDLPKEIQDQIDNFSAAFLAKHTPTEVQD